MRGSSNKPAIRFLIYLGRYPGGYGLFIAAIEEK